MTTQRLMLLNPRHDQKPLPRRGERGAIVVHVAIALLGLLAFSSFSIDHGVMMVSRGQAQNAADAGAWAAANYLAWDNPGDFAGAQAVGVAAALQNGVWGSQPDITTADVTFPPCPPGAPGPPDTCVKVDVFRNQRANGNPLPVFFASLLGQTEQGVRATATAQVVFGTGTNCLLPFAIPDRWLELRDDEAGAPPEDSLANFPDDEPEGLSNLPDGYWDPDDTYDAFYSQGANQGDPIVPGPVDDYDPNPGGTGYRMPRDHGIKVLLKAANGSQIAPDWYYPIVLPDGCGTGANCYRDRIANCSDVEIPDDFLFTNEPGNMVGPTRQGVLDAVAADGDASWEPMHLNADGTRGTVDGGCMELGTCARSPRLRAVAVFDVENYMSGHITGRLDILVTGFVGMWLEGMQGNNVEGYITTFDFEPNSGNTTDDTSSFLRNVILVR